MLFEFSEVLSWGEGLNLAKCEKKEKEMRAVKVLKPVGTEYCYVFFWWLFETFFGRILTNIIEEKTITLIINRGDKNDVEKLLDPKTKEKTLARFRRNFADCKLKEIFFMRTLFFSKGSELMKRFCENVANAPALDIVYNAFGHFKLSNKTVWPLLAKPDFLSNFHLACPNGQSVRNRYRMVKDLFKKTGGGKSLSIACGSAQPIIDAIHDLVKDGDTKTTLTLYDAEQRSLNVAHGRACDAGIENRIERVQGDISELITKFDGRKFNVIEFCGILDYLPGKVAKKLISNALSLLEDGGTIIVSNMAETVSAEYLRKLYNWEIIYRTPKELGELVVSAGGKNVQVFNEPWGIHPVATATR